MHRRSVLKGMAASGVSLAGAGVARAQTPSGRWIKLESTNFVIYSSSDEVYSRTELVALEGFHNLLIRLMPPRSKSALKLNIYMSGNDRDFDMAWPGAGNAVAGFYTASVEEVLAVTSKRGAVLSARNTQRELDSRTVLFHEYAHHYMMANQHAAYPAWYVEGFAEYLSTAEFADKGIYIGKFTPDRAFWLARGRWVDIRTFLGRRRDLDQEEVAKFYSQAWLATHYLFNNPERSKGFDRYIAALTKGGDPIDAFEPSFGITPQAFEQELKVYRSKGIEFRLMPGVALDSSTPIAVERLGRSADELVTACAFIRQLPGRKGAAGTVAAIRSQARKYPGDPYVMHAEAFAEIWYGDLVRAQQIVDTLLASDASRAETLHLSGLCHLRASYASGDKEALQKARTAFAAAHRQDGTRANSHFRYAECALQLGGQLDSHLLDVLLAAYQLAPQVNAIALMTAQGLMQHERFEEAAFVLRPLASDVHGGAMSETAETILTAALARQKSDIVFFGSAKEAAEETEP